jgi:hypothetical protein
MKRSYTKPTAALAVSKLQSVTAGAPASLPIMKVPF